MAARALSVGGARAASMASCVTAWVHSWRGNSRRGRARPADATGRPPQGWPRTSFERPRNTDTHSARVK